SPEQHIEYETEDESLYEAQAYENNDDLEALRSKNDNAGLEEYCLEDNEENSSKTLSDDDPEDYENSDFSTGESGAYSDDFLDYTPSPAESFRDELLQELNTRTGLSEEFSSLCESIITSLEDNGLLASPLADIAMSSGHSLEDVEQALEFVQQFDPPGIAARNMAECWLLQLKRKDALTPELEKMLTEYWDDLLNNRLNIVVKNLNISMEQLQAMLRELASLTPYPVRAERNRAQVIFPEVEIISAGNGIFSARPVRERRSFKLSKYAETDAPDAGADFQEKVREGKMLIEALEYRKGTLLRMAEMLIDIQHSFLESGPEKLKPFTMKQAAEYLGISESTVSRAAAEKYIKTPQGIMPLKSFFTAGYVSEEGEAVSRTADMELLKKLVDEEDKRKPLSDEKLSQLLCAAGHPVARRTVVKYREKMNIPNSSLRKEFF
ncbi:MAG: RNA polymerase factor sigma-54, partial [Lentisphaeria bacterium]|nr:RNA polymerase factor sigma-54 [Lentisphaeria bacterium]